MKINDIATEDLAPYNNLTIRFVENVKRIAESKEYPLEKLERELNLTRGFLSRDIYRITKISLDSAITISLILNTPFEDFLVKNS